MVLNILKPEKFEYYVIMGETLTNFEQKWILKFKILIFSNS
jgi:hypothetical protein